MKEAKKVWLCINAELFLAKSFAFWEFGLFFRVVILGNT